MDKETGLVKHDMGNVRGESRLIGVIYVRGEMINLRKKVEVMGPDENDMRLIQGLTKEFCNHFNFEEAMSGEFTKIAGGLI